MKQQTVLNSLGGNCTGLRDTRNMLYVVMEQYKSAEKCLRDTCNMLYVVMEQCKSAEKCVAFVQDVPCAPEPMAVLYNEQQLRDMERFCCDPFNFGILGNDSTLI